MAAPLSRGLHDWDMAPGRWLFQIQQQHPFEAVFPLPPVIVYVTGGWQRQQQSVKDGRGKMVAGMSTPAAASVADDDSKPMLQNGLYQLKMIHKMSEDDLLHSGWLLMSEVKSNKCMYRAGMGQEWCTGIIWTEFEGGSASCAGERLRHYTLFRAFTDLYACFTYHSYF